jgi:23S rRNA (uracil1939-C5)-methyltransferase
MELEVEELEVRIERLGAQGDGVAQGPNGPIFVPFTLPGELVKVSVEPGETRAKAIAIIEPSPDRVAPVCPHFGTCGGCALQHMESHAYLAWKREQVIATLASRGLEALVEPMRPVPLSSRRRATFAVARTAQGLALGYRAARSHAIIDIAACPVLSPGIALRLGKLKTALAPLVTLKGETCVSLTETDTGLDWGLEGARPSPSLLTGLAASGASLGVARVTVDGESLTLQGEPVVTLSGARVKLPAGAFLQASREAEEILVALVTEATTGAKRIADLFAGIGTFTFALAARTEADAFEADEAATGALADAARTTPRLKPVRTHVRDLFRVPLSVKELARYDAVVLDPPRAGAKAQAEALAGSKVPRIVMVSCNPGTCARDLRTLVDGGYRITRIVPIDQFLFSPHIELVAVLER